MLAVSSFLITGLDFVAIWIMFGNVDDLGGFSLTEIAFLYGATGLGIGFADLVVGSVERLGQMIRTGRLDTMMTKPVPLLVQVCADEFAHPPARRGSLQAVPCSAGRRRTSTGRRPRVAGGRRDGRLRQR